MRQRGEDVFFLTGTDEHGEPVAQAAEREGVAPRELADRNAERFKRVAERVNATNDFFIRTSDEEHKAVGRPGGRADEGERPRLRGHLRGLVLPPLRGLQDRQRADRGRQVPDPPDRARAREGGQLVLPAVRLPGAARAAVRGQPGVGAAGQPLQRGAVVHQGRAARLLAQPRADLVGRAGAVGPRAGGLRVGGRAAQLLHGALLRARGRGPHGALLARVAARDRQGHPEVPRGLLAGAADGGRPRGAAAGLHPRLPADGRPQDVEVAGQRARPVRRDGPLRHRRPALLPAARGGLRPGRLDLAGGLRDALQHRAGQRVRQPRQPHAGDDRPLSRRHGARGRRSGRAGGGVRRARRPRVASCSTAWR